MLHPTSFRRLLLALLSAAFAVVAAVAEPDAVSASGLRAEATSVLRSPARIGAPRGVAATPGDRVALLSWRSSRPRSRVRSYAIHARMAGTRWRRRPTVVTKRRAKLIGRLRNGKRYAFRITARDRHGRPGRRSRVVYATPRAGLPLPTDPSATGPRTAADPAPGSTAPGQGSTPSSPGDVCPSFGPYAAGNWPGSCWRPYAATSPFNRPIPADPPLLSNSAEIVQRLLSWGSPQTLAAGHADTSDDYFHPLYYAQRGDPLYTVHCTRWTGNCPVEGHQLRIPQAARPAAGDDGHMTVIDQASGWEYDFWQVADKPAGGGTLNVSHGGRTRIDGDGLGSNATAAWFGLAAGIIRGPEIQAGEIRHALFSQIKCSGGYAVYPARAGTAAAPCSNFGASNTNAPPLGARIQLAMSDAEIDALGVPAWKRTILKALAHYGLIVGDTMNNNSSWGLQGESGSSYTSFGAIDPWTAVAQTSGVAGSPGSGYWFDVGSGVDWSRLRVVHPCVSSGTC